MAEEIKHGFISVKDVFLNKWYRIPEYQRPYVWEKEQVDALLDDIMNEAEKLKDKKQFEPSAQREYFLGSLVWRTTIKTDGSSNYEEFEVLDGQQRLTTMLLIHAVIRDLTNNQKRKTTCEEAIYQEANPDDGIPERLRLVFGIRGEAEKFIDTYVKTDKGTLAKEQLIKIQKNGKDVNCVHMAEVILAIHDYFSDNTQEKIETFFGFFRSNTKLIFISSTNLEDAFHLFNVMNNRGIKLRNSDILKAKNLSKIKDLAKRENYAEEWEKIENYFGEDFDQFLEFIRLCVVKKKAAVSLLKEFEDNIYNPTEYDRITKVSKKLPPLLTEGESTLDCIIKYFNSYTSVFDGTYPVATQNLIKTMDFGIEAKFWKAAVLQYHLKFGDKKIAEFLTRLNRKFTADWIDELYFTKRIENTCEIIDAIDKATDEDKLFISDAFEYDKALTSEQLKGQLYGKKYCRYLLLLASVILTGDEPLQLPEIVSIEHILPQNPKSDSKWLKDFTPAQREECTNKIGNLMLISRRKNSSLGNYEYEKKKEKYFNENVGCFALSIKVYSNYITWTYSDYEKNQEEIIKRFVEYFKL